MGVEKFPPRLREVTASYPEPNGPLMDQLAKMLEDARSGRLQAIGWAGVEYALERDEKYDFLTGFVLGRAATHSKLLAGAIVIAHRLTVWVAGDTNVVPIENYKIETSLDKPPAQDKPPTEDEDPELPFGGA